MLGYYSYNINSSLIATENKGFFCTDPINCFIYAFSWGFYQGDGIGGRNLIFSYKNNNILDIILKFKQIIIFFLVFKKTLFKNFYKYQTNIYQFWYNLSFSFKNNNI